MIPEPETRMVKLSELRPANYNPRKISDSSFEGLGNSIERFGLMVPIIWNERSGNIVGGHQRYKHLLENGEEETEVVVVDLDDQEEVALNIVLNNKFVRGKFTKDVVNLLEMVEVKIGSAFNDIGLSDLHEHVKKIRFDFEEEEEEPETKSKDKGDPPDRDESSSADPNAVIRCPRCRSAWRMDSNEVLHNGIVKQ